MKQLQRAGFRCSTLLNELEFAIYGPFFCVCVVDLPTSDLRPWHLSGWSQDFSGATNHVMTNRLPNLIAFDLE